MDLKIIKGETYKYKELCEIFNTKPTDGNSRNAQFKEWKRYIDWTKPTSQKYLITEVYDTPKEKEDGRKNNGGAREGAGSKGKLHKEFDYLLNYFISYEYNKNKHYLNKPQWHISYFTKDRISRFFGLYNNLTKAKYDEDVNLEVYYKIADKIREKQRGWIIDKLKRMEERNKEHKKRDTDKFVLLVDGIMAYKSKKNRKNPDYRDDLLEDYNKYKEEYMERNHFKTDRDIIQAGKWEEMSNEVSSYFIELGYELVVKCHKLFFNPKEKQTYDYNIVKEYKHHYNDEIIKELYKYFFNEEKKYFEKHPDEDEDYQIALMQAQPDESVDYKINEEKIMQPYVYILDSYIRI